MLVYHANSGTNSTEWHQSPVLGSIVTSTIPLPQTSYYYYQTVTSMASIWMQIYYKCSHLERKPQINQCK